MAAVTAGSVAPIDRHAVTTPCRVVIPRSASHASTVVPRRARSAVRVGLAADGRIFLIRLRMRQIPSPTVSS